MNKMSFSSLFTTAALIFFAGCTPKRGQFLDPPVAGVRYDTETISGVTDANGEFAFEEGETVTFRLGDVILGSVAAVETITPFDLAGTVAPTAASDIVGTVNRIKSLNVPTSFEKAANISQFLQTLDSDSNAQNGLQISDAIHEFFT